MCLKYFADIKNSLTCFYLYKNDSRRAEEGTCWYYISRLFFCVASLRFCRMFYSTCSSGTAGLISICHQMVVTLLLSLVGAVDCWYCAGRKAPCCYTGDGTLWRSMKTELGSGVNLCLWDLLMGGCMFEGTPGTFCSLCVLLLSLEGLDSFSPLLFSLGSSILCLSRLCQMPRWTVCFFPQHRASTPLIFGLLA